MKTKVIFYIPNHFKKMFFPVIRKKKDIILLFVETIKFIKTHSFQEEKSDFKIIIQIDNMSRFIYSSLDKHFSLIFPFKISIKESNYEFFLKDGTELSFEFLSKITKLINNDIFSRTLDSLIEEIIDESKEQKDIVSDFDNKIWNFFKEMYSLEYGYLRYDYDKEHENGKIHPLNHLDICYSNEVTFKIGLNKKISSEEMIEILDNNLERKFLNY